MRKILLLIPLITSCLYYCQSSVDSVLIPGNGNYMLERKKELALKDYVLVSSDKDYTYSIKVENTDDLYKKIWLQRTHTLKRVKNKNGKWTEYKPKDKTVTLIRLNCNEKQYGLLERYSYNKDGKVTDIQSGSGNYSHIVPDSIIDEISKIACYK